MKGQIDTLIQLMDCPLADQPEWFLQMCKDLSCCSACVDQYHNAMKMHVSHFIVYNWNCKRICDCLEEGVQLLDSIASHDDNDELCEETQSIMLCIETAIKEVLKYPRLMLNRELCIICLKSLKLLLKRNEGFVLDERLQGLCLLLFNQDKEVCTCL